MAIHNKLHMILVLGSTLALMCLCFINQSASTAIPEGGLTVSQLYQQSISEPIQSWSVKRTLTKPVNYAKVIPVMRPMKFKIYLSLWITRKFLFTCFLMWP